MIEAPVGWLCPVCAREGRQPARVRSLGAPPRVTYALLGLIAAGFVAQVTLDGDTLAVTARLATWGLAIDLNGEWWRVITGGFVHSTGNLLHVLFNGYLLYRLGQLMEPALGPARFGALYFTSLVGGSLGAVVLAPTSPAIGASGAVFGLMGALLVVYRQRGLNPFRTDIGTLLLLNLVITFVVPRISIGGHIGGLVAGAIVGALYVRMARTPDARLLSAQLAVGLGLVLWIGTVVAAGALIQI
ncbi:MAG: rhomboid family intramembrane serine protease [Nitriliruptorales bacterium]|nr:rhomboid family intramembrane serine protease [Nitriliruptorales bacterium]